MTEKRKKITDMVLKIVKLLDASNGFNYDKYKAIFDKMTDKEFGDWCNWCNDPDNLDQLDHTISIEAMPFDEPSLQNIFKGLDTIGVPAEEYVYFRQFSDRPVRSKYRIPVGYLAIKRMEQLLSKKNRYTLDNEQRSIKSDQVSQDSKVANISEPEAAALMSIGADAIFKEMYGARSGDEAARNNLYKGIALNGYATLQDADADSSLDTKATLNTLNTYLLASGLRTDLVSDSLTLPYTLKKALSGGKR